MVERRSPKPKVAGSIPSTPATMKGSKRTMPQISPFMFIKQVRQEMAKVSWPSRKETLLTSLMVFIISLISAIFFLTVDSIIAFIISKILK